MTMRLVTEQTSTLSTGKNNLVRVGAAGFLHCASVTNGHVPEDAFDIVLQVLVNFTRIDSNSFPKD